MDKCLFTCIINKQLYVIFSLLHVASLNVHIKHQKGEKYDLIDYLDAQLSGELYKKQSGGGITSL